MSLVPLRIGLVNLMPPEARLRTERQFRDILAAASGSRPVELVLLCCEAAALGRPEAYADVATLATSPVDGLIVTGMPPRATTLVEEPGWPILAWLADFAVSHAIPTVWSCLAAHAAVLRLDGIERRRLPLKLSGLVECRRVEFDHPIVQRLPLRWLVPHSRYNDLPEEMLRARGYRIIACASAAGADIFVKEIPSLGTGHTKGSQQLAGRDPERRNEDALFLFFQGHPEYDADTLWREYRRDVRQFLGGERDAYPSPPEGGVSPILAERLAAFRDRAVQARCEGSPEPGLEFPWAACVANLGQPWRDLAVAVYANWLAYAALRRVSVNDAAEVECVRLEPRRAEMTFEPVIAP